MGNALKILVDKP